MEEIILDFAYDSHEIIKIFSKYQLQTFAQAGKLFS